jgi:hypothetical protein
MRWFLTCTPKVLHRCDLTSGSRRERCEARYPARDIPTVNHAVTPFIENKRYRMKPRRIDDVVNRNAVFVYQTDAVLVLAGGVQGRLQRERFP